MEKRILHLVLYSPEPIYNDMALETMNYYKHYEDIVHTVYYYCDENISETTLSKNGRILILKNIDKSILETTLTTLKFFNPEDYSFLVRSTVSTVLNFDLLIPQLKNEYSGFQIKCESKYKWIPYVHGSCIIFNNDTWKWIINNTDKIDKSLPDDVSFGTLLRIHRSEIFITELSPSNVEFFNKHINCDKNIIYTNHISDSNRKYDIDNVKYVCKMLRIRERMKGQIVLNIKYGSLDTNAVDVTDKIKSLSKTEDLLVDVDDNAKIDPLFGDPCPNIKKVLFITFSDSSTFNQSGIYTFTTEENCLTIR